MMEGEDTTGVSPREQAPDHRYGEALLYDFAKFLISLPLLVLGAMLTLSEAAREGDVKLTTIYIIVGALSLTAVIAFSVAHALVDARASGKEPSSRLAVVLKLATGLFGMGVGGFLFMWIDTLA
jgi:divalent metal cation (Fe/Co/Zn/Cd) transporter